jgi:hypothetical protein
VVAFGRVEYLVKLTVKSLSGKRFTAGMTEAESQGEFRRLCHTGKTYAADRLSANEAAEYGQLLERAQALAIERNDNVHALWSALGGSSARYRPFYSRTEKALRWRSRPVHHQELNVLAERMMTLAAELDKARKAWTLTVTLTKC